ncbi:class I adenylate-forming enzyme family protein [Pusillimonas noertemannii]|uniref:Long-chain acyl-CoA synthetase n=1 Tax=Pusillimonas noertemannii TaxID=305977 RepID=A0A2U1CQU8_9BURK|nr:long-chain-fatty-acid--CoA ligase [Pusillimonas noertemannii]NYT67591.1 long-chain-fatty-acid--CoA ligase [Pusillimonas noertemannii]PVY68263.1 long-chain acyl-CoA synthetase [Pusillimonas noertemannii]TFL12243.1 long-chain-fatty-acid--CoA ligase [Pusillimonas noertemannii]
MFPISQILPRARALYADRLAISDGELRFTFEELGNRVDALVGGLKSKGLQPGDRIAILDVNSYRYAEMYYACAQAGFILLPLNSRLAPLELKFVLEDSGAKALVVTEPFFETAEGLTIDVLIKDYDALIASAPPDTHVADAALDDIVQIYYTSGTTGEPKGVCLTHRNMVASAFDSIVAAELGQNDIWLHAAPMFHLVDAWALWSMPLLGAAQVMVHFAPEKMMEVVQKAKPTAVALPPTLINMIINHPKVHDYDLSSLRLIMYGGSPAPLGVLQKAVEVIPTSYLQAYGTTETSGMTALASACDFHVTGTAEQQALTSNAGRPVPHIRLEIFDDNAQPLPRGQVGEVVISGARVMKEYWNKPEHTAEALKDGWYHTGDVGYVDDAGRLFIVDRKKDMIISGGENVYSVEVESLISQHPAVLEVAVIGVPDKQWGEAVKAIVVARDGTFVTAEDIVDFCRGKIAGYKIPKSFDFSQTPLPKTGPGKIAKRHLRNQYWAGSERAL